MSAAAIQQFYQQGVQLAQAGWMYECMGNPAAAGAHYHQALQTLDVCGRLPGIQPVDRLYWMGSCQLRLGYLCHLGGNFAWAQGWFGLAQQSLQQACQFDPGNPAYRGLLGQLAQLGGGGGGGSGGGGSSKPVWELVKKGLGILPDLIDLFKGSGDNGTGGPPASAVDWSGMMGGMGWTGDDPGMGGYGY